MADLRPTPTLSRRHVTGAESARGLLFTVLGEFVLPAGGAAWTSAFIDVLARLGVAEKACRQALTRTAADGWLRPERVGRRTRWLLTAAAERLLIDGADRIYGFAGASADWDGRWLLVLARVPETDRPTRHLLRTRLAWAGLGSPSPGVWVSTHPQRSGEVEKVLADIGILGEAQLFFGEYGGGGDLAQLARQAWDLDALDARYRQFLAEFAGAEAPDPLARLVELVHAWRRFPWLDPGLPRALLPAQWSGSAAAALFARRHAQWAPAATAQWRRISR